MKAKPAAATKSRHRKHTKRVRRSVPVKPTTARRKGSVGKPANTGRAKARKAQSASATGTGQSMASSKQLLRAGLSALSLPRAESAMADGLSKIADSFGFKKLEGVFDQRVASALERIGFPSAAALLQLSDRVEQLSQRLERRKAKARR